MTDSDSTFKDRVKEIQNERKRGLEDSSGRPAMSEVSGSLPINSSVATPSVENQPKTRLPKVALVCVDCQIYYEHSDDWDHCPKCGDELLGVKRDE